jgi:hypothetical protein
MRLPDQINEISSHHVNGITYFTLPIEPTLHEELIRQLKELIDGDLPHMERIVGCIPTGDVSVGCGAQQNSIIAQHAFALPEKGSHVAQVLDRFKGNDQVNAPIRKAQASAVAHGKRAIRIVNCRISNCI